MKTLEDQKLAFEALSDPTRLRMIRVLIISKAEVCQCEFVDVLETSPANISRHAKVLYHARLIREKKEGKWMYYHLSDPRSEVLKAIVKGNDPVFQSDEKRLKKRLRLRCGGKCLVGVQNKKFKRG